jgi:hypothetical protein
MKLKKKVSLTKANYILVTLREYRIFNVITLVYVKEQCVCIVHLSMLTCEIYIIHGKA